MFYLFSVQGGNTFVAAKEAQKALSDPNRHWQVVQTVLGKLHCGIPNVHKRNFTASRFFEQEIYGDCILETTAITNPMLVPAICIFERTGSSLRKQSAGFDLPS